MSGGHPDGQNRDVLKMVQNVRPEVRKEESAMAKVHALPPPPREGNQVD